MRGLKYLEQIKHFWELLITAKPAEAWLAIMGGAAYVWHKSGNITRFGKSVEAGISGLISVGLGEDVIQVTGYPPAIVHFVIAVFSFAILDFSMSMFADKEELAVAMRAFLYRWLGIEFKKALPTQTTEKPLKNEAKKPESKCKTDSEEQ